MNSRTFTAAFLTLLTCTSGNNYPEVISFKGAGYEVRIYSKDGDLNVGLNDIRVEVKPPAKIEELYLYMPEMENMPEMKDYAQLKEEKKGVYSGSISISMEGPWELRIKVNGKDIRKEITIPVKGGASENEKHSH